MVLLLLLLGPSHVLHVEEVTQHLEETCTEQKKKKKPKNPPTTCGYFSFCRRAEIFLKWTREGRRWRVVVVVVVAAVVVGGEELYLLV